MPPIAASPIRDRIFGIVSKFFPTDSDLRALTSLESQQHPRHRRDSPFKKLWLTAYLPSRQMRITSCTTVPSPFPGLTMSRQLCNCR
jgi:hypothetical protein